MSGDAIKRTLMLALVGVALIFLYTLVHEGGHAIAALLLGGRITSFDVNFITSSPHVSYTGVQASSGHAFVAIAGPLFPILCWLAVAPLLRQRNCPLAHLTKLAASTMLVFSMLLATVFSLAYAVGANVPTNDDIIKFLSYSGISPLLAALCFIGLAALLLYLMLNYLQGKEFILEQIQAAKTTQVPVGKRILILIAILAVVLFAAPMIVRITEPSVGRFVPPVEYDTRFELLLSNIGSEWETVHEFSLEETQMLDLYYTLTGSKPSGLRLVTDNEAGLLLNNDKQVTILPELDSSTWGLFTGIPLHAGNYRLESRTQSNSGSLTLYVTVKDPLPSQEIFVQLIELLSRGAFSPDDFTEDGYEMIYTGQLEDLEDELIYTFSPSIKPIEISTFVSGPFSDVTLTYSNRRQQIKVLNNMRLSSLGLTPDLPGGQLRLTSSAAVGRIYVFVKER